MVEEWQKNETHPNTQETQRPTSQNNHKKYNVLWFAGEGAALVSEDPAVMRMSFPHSPLTNNPRGWGGEAPAFSHKWGIHSDIQDRDCPCPCSPGPEGLGCHVKDAGHFHLNSPPPQLPSNRLVTAGTCPTTAFQMLAPAFAAALEPTHQGPVHPGQPCLRCCFLLDSHDSDDSCRRRKKSWLPLKAL